MSDAEQTQRKQEFLRTAATDSIDSAVIQFGDAINAREAMAIRTLTKAELEELYRLNKKIVDATSLGGASAGAARWTVGDTC